MSDHADTIRRALRVDISSAEWNEVNAALDALVAENKRLREALFIIANHSASEDSRRVARDALDGTP